MKRVLVVGGAGFIGSYIVKLLLERKIIPIIFDSFFQYLPTIKPNENKINALRDRFKEIADEKVILVRGNATNYGEIRKVLEMYDPDCVINLASLPLANLSNIYIEEALDGVKATGTIIQAIHDIERNIKFIYTSSSTVYGDFEYEPADENHPKNPKGVYAGVKLAGEYITCSFCRQFDIPYIIIRPSGVYGPTDINERVVQRVIENAISGKKIIINDPKSKIDFTYVKDTAKGFLLATLSRKVKNDVFNISYGKGRTLGELVDIIKQYFPKLEIEVRGRDENLPSRGSLDITKARKKLGYKPEYPLERGIKEYVGYYMKNDYRKNTTM